MDTPTVKLHDKTFVRYIDNQQITAAVERLAQQISHDYRDTIPLMVVVLDGSIIFASELMQRMNMPVEMCTLRISSYHGTASTGVCKQLIGIDRDITGRSVIIIEDIVDTGLTIQAITDLLKEKNVKDIKIAALTLKKDVYQGKRKIDYVGIEIENKFIVGYGLDYNYLGRNLKDIYKLMEN